MGVSYNPQIVTNGLVCNFDIANQKSYSPNVHPKPLDLYGWINTATGNNCTLSVDTTTPSPVGNINRPLKMVQTGGDTFTYTYNAATWNLAPAVAGQTWTVSVWVKASVAMSIEGCWIAEHSAAGGYLAGGGSPNPTIGTNWTRISGTYTLVNASTAYVAVRLDGTQVSGAGTVWWDGLQLERSASMTTFNSFTNTNNAVLTDTSWNGNTGILTNNPIYSSAGYLNFVAASTQYIVLNPAITSMTQFLGTLPCSFEAWVYPTTNPGAGGYPGIICRESNPGTGRDGYNLLFHGSATTDTNFAFERFVAGVNNGTGYSTIISSVISLNSWHYIVGTYDGYNVSLYRNGEFVSSAASTGSITNTTATVNIGVLSGTQYFNGRISATRIYNVALTATEIHQNFNAIRGRYGI